VTMPFGYVSPEQVMKDRADYARKGIARGRSVIVLVFDGGILFVGENPSRALHKISEIYDRIAFAAVGKYNEFENLRMAGVRYADLRGYSYDRQDVTGRGLANVFAQTLGAIFTQESKPFEVEIAIGEVGQTADEDQIYRLTYDGSVAEERGFVVMGGQAEQINTELEGRYQENMTLADALTMAVDLLGRDPAGGEHRTVAAAHLEVAVLDRARPRRTFRRITGALLNRLLGQEGAADPGGKPEPHGSVAPDQRDTSPPTALAGGAPEPPGPDRDDDEA
jgi:proteasome alpha subunit